MTHRDDLNTPLIALVGFLGAVIVFVIVVLLMVVYRGVETEHRFRTDVSQPYGELSDLSTRQRETLASYGWVDREKGVVSVPIGRAINLVVREIRTEGRAAVTLPDDASEAPKDDDDPPATDKPDDTTSTDEKPDEAGVALPPEPEEPQSTDEPKEVGDAKPE